MIKLSRKKRIAIAIALMVCLVAAIAVFLLSIPKAKPAQIAPKPAQTPTAATSTAPQIIKSQSPRVEIIGNSVQNRPIEIYSFGNGSTKLIFTAGIHGGYEWNTTLLAYELIDHFQKNPKLIPDGLTVAIIPSLNPDGLFKITRKTGRFEIAGIPAGGAESGRLNANGVDLNRNFDCNWKSTGTWRQKPVSGGTAAFSEPESAALKRFIIEHDPAAVVFYHSQSNAVYGSMCGGSILAQTRRLMDLYSKASGYPAKDTFDQYQVTGDASDWLASIDIPAISIELKTHETSEFAKNLAGVAALFEYYSVKP